MKLNEFLKQLIDEKIDEPTPDGRKWYVVTPEKFYPPALDQLESDLRSGNRKPGFESIYNRAMTAYAAGAWPWAKQSREDTPEEQREARVEALEAARLYATKILREDVAQAPIGLRILKTEAGARFKL